MPAGSGKIKFTAAVRRFTMEKEQYLEVYRHSLAHILAKAVIELYGKEVQYAIGPQIADGFY